MLIDCVRIGACVRSIRSQMSMVPSDLAIKNTPGRDGDHSASQIRLVNVLVWRRAPVLKKNKDTNHSKSCIFLIPYNQMSNFITTGGYVWYPYKSFFSPNAEASATGNKNDIFEERRALHGDHRAIAY